MLSFTSCRGHGISPGNTTVTRQETGKPLLSQYSQPLLSIGPCVQIQLRGNRRYLGEAPLQHAVLFFSLFPKHSTNCFPQCSHHTRCCNLGWVQKKREGAQRLYLNTTQRPQSPMHFTTGGPDQEPLDNKGHFITSKSMSPF